MSHPAVIDLIHEAFVPVWVNVRISPIPDVACLESVLDQVQVDPDGRILGGFNQGFFLRSVVLGPDGSTLLNPQPGHAALEDLVSPGYFPYAQVKPQDYLPMLRGALARSSPRKP